MAMPVRCAPEKNRRRSIRRIDALLLRRSAVSIAVGALLGGASAFAGQPGQILPAGTIPQVRGVVFGNAVVNPSVAIPGGNRLTVDQTSQKTIIEWNSFDIARGSEVQFNQPNAGASALNRIFGLDPSVIQGKLTANGQIILINQNGILFDAGSQVNAHSLIASTLAITDDVFKNGITANLDSSALKFEGVTGYKKIEVAGAANGLGPATLTSDTGGNIILLAPNVVNNGVITSPDGQVILAAGSSVLLFQPRDQNSSQMRGYFVQVTADAGPMNLTSLVTNLGTISADRGNVTLAGLAVNQLGRVTARTAVNRNGSIWLIAQDAATLGAGSATETPLDTADTTTLAEDQDYSAFRASIKVIGNTIVDRGTIRSPSGSVILSTQQSAAVVGDVNHSSTVAYTPGQTGINSGPTRIFLDQGAIIDTAGGWVDLSLSRNLVNVRITSNDLKDDPVQKGGSLLGQTVTVDVRKGTPLFDVSGYAGAIQRSVSEKATTGGDISLLSQGDLIVQQGALMDVSGGGYRYAGGNLKTTTLVSGGRVYDISNAPIDLRYDAAINGTYQRVHAKWGVTQTYTTLLSQVGVYEPGYVQGKSAGSITLDGSSVIVNGTMRAGVTAGPQQTSVTTMPAAGSLTVGVADTTRANLYLLNNISFVDRAVALPSVFDGAVDALPQDRIGTALLAVGDLFKPAVSSADRYQQDGFASLSAGSNRQIDLPSGIVVRTPVGGGITLTSNAISIAGSIVAPGGNVAIKAAGTGANSVGSPSLEVLSGAQILTAGLWVNDRTNPGATGNQQAFPHAIDGGSVTLASDYALVLNAGSVIDVSGGAARSSSGAITSGNGGSIKIVGGSAASGVFDGRLSLNGSLRGYAAGTGGSIDVTASKILIGATTADPQTLSIASEFFQTGGFTSYKLTGYYNTTLADGAQIAPVAENFVIDPGAAVTQSGGNLAAVAHISGLPVWQRTASSLTLVASGDQQLGGVGLTIGTGSAIRTDPGASVTLTSRSGLDVLGTIDAPAGSITISQNSDLPNPSTVHIGGSAVLSSRGYFMPQPTRLGLVQGQVLRGGTIALNSPGSIQIDSGSLIDVSATSMTVQVPGSMSSNSPFTTVNIDGNAGVVSVAAAGSATLAGEFRGNAAPTAAGGTFTLDLAGNRNSGATARAIVLTQDGIVSPPGGTVDGAVVSLDNLMRGGFDKVRLSSTDAIRFDGDVSFAAARSIELGAPVFNVNGGNVKLASNQVRLDGLSIDPTKPLSLASNETSHGGGSLNVFAGLIDLVGGITVNGVAQVRLNSAGDIRATGVPVRVAPVVSGDQAGVPDSLKGYFVTPGNLSLSAQQVYPTTLSQFRFSIADVAQNNGALVETPVAGGRIDVARAPGAPAPVLSIGGNVTFTADTIDVHGTVAAPLGNIAFNGATNVTLESDSRISVSLNGVVAPFGVTVNGQTLTYAGIQDVKLPSKGISTNAPNVFIKDGAVLDVSGGGELQAVEWVPGIGGSADVLLADNAYAILPSLRLDYAPYDTDLRARKTLGFNADAGVYDTVYLAGGNGIAAGYYPLLPGYYALLPGAYKVTPQTGGTAASIQPGQRLSLRDGTPLIAGKFAIAGTGIQTQTWSAFAVESGALVSREAEYTLSNSAFFAAQAVANNLAVPPLPREAGRFSVSASNQLTFAPTLLGSPASGGNGAQVDISAPDILVASGPVGGAGTGVQLDANKLSALNASLLLGGTRTDTADGTTLNVGANTVTVAAGVLLGGPEIILAANQAVTIESGATVRGAGTFSGTAGDLQITGANGNGALLRASSGNQVNVTRTGTVDRSQGTLTIANGAVVSASRSLILDSTKTTQSSGSLTVADGGFVSLGAGAISVGGTGPASTDSLLIGTAELAGFSKLDTIALRSYTSIDFNGDVLLGGEGFNGITLDAATIRGLGAGAASLQARNITLLNTGVNSGVATAGAGSLTLVADSIILGKGSKALSGFSDVTLSARGDITGMGVGDLRTGAEVTLVSNRVTGGLRSDQSIAAIDDSTATKTYYKVSLQKSATPLAATGNDALGAKFAITGSSIDHFGDIEFSSGSIALTATGPGGITLQEGSRISAAGGQKTFGPTTVAAPGGTVTLTALRGNVTSAAGSSIDVSGAASGGDAGTFSLTTSATTAVVQLDGNLTGAAGAGFVQGSAVLDLASAGDFSALNAKLNQGGFSESRDIRIRSGDVVVAAADPVTQRAADIVVARRFKLSADDGSITVGGTIDASGAAGGGSIELDAMNDLTLSNGSSILARGTSAASGAANPYSHGGSVELSSRTGTLSMEAGASVDVSANAAGKSNGGKVIFSAARTANASGADADVAMNLAGKVGVGGGANGGTAGTVTIEGVHGYDGVTDTASASDPAGIVASDYKSFVGNSQAIISRLTTQGLVVDGSAAATALRVSGGVELRSTGDMVVSSPWDLTSADWMPSAIPGRLTLRAAGNLIVQNTLGFPDDNLATSESWSIRMTGGADLQSADAMAVQPLSAGNVVFSNLATFSYLNPRTNVGAWSGGAAKVRTGTGSIQISAGGDVVIQGPPTLATDGRVVDSANMSNAPKVVIYTAGLPVLDGAIDSVYPTRGGDISIYAKGNITGAGGQLEYVNDWLRRTSSTEQGAIEGGPAGWWVARSVFRDDVGALGGGNISFVAGGNIANVSAAVPTFGRTYTDSTGAPAIDVQGGGNLDIRAGGNLDGGEYLLGRGVGHIAVGGSIGQTSAPALYLMGQSTDPALRGASYRVVAGGDITIQNVSNPTILVSSSVPTQLDDSGEFLPGFEKFRAAFFSYDDSSGVDLLSVGGNLTIPGKQAARTSRQALSGDIDSQWSDFLPPHFSAVALQGGITGDHVQPGALPTLLYPAAGSTLRLLAANTISNVAIEATDLTPAAQANWGWNSAFELNQERALSPDAIKFDATVVNRMVAPSLNGGYEFVVASAAGDVLDSTFMFSRQSWVSAGRDLRDVRLDLQNLADGDISVVKAGRDIRYVPAYSNGILDRADQGGYIRIGGPGRLLVQAGRNVDLGATEGITAGGNNFNTSLPNSKSAALTILAGVTGDVAFDAIDALFVDLQAAGLARKSAIADAAIQKLFNDDNTNPGNITMFFSAIKTQGGSGIDLLVPNGNINAGLPTPGGGNIGVYTTFGGGIRTYLSGDFNVNQSKVATLDGGNILIYSSNGNIDAGRGARDSRTTQAPQRVAILDDQGNPTGLFTFIPPSDASGSGIRSLTFDPDGPGPLASPKPGDIFLFAPRGFIDAGEAGVSSAGNIFVAALQVLNANNFSAAGSSVGVPVAVNSGISAGLSGASSVGASAAKSAEDITKSLTTAAATVPKDIYRPSFISVEVLGVGEDASQKDDKDKK